MSSLEPAMLDPAQAKYGLARSKRESRGATHPISAPTTNRTIPTIESMVAIRRSCLDRGLNMTSSHPVLSTPPALRQSSMDGKLALVFLAAGVGMGNGRGGLGALRSGSQNQLPGWAIRCDHA